MLSENKQESSAVYDKEMKSFRNLKIWRFGNSKAFLEKFAGCVRMEGMNG